LRESVELERPLLRSQHNPLIEVAIAVVGYDGRGAYPTQMIKVIVGVDKIAGLGIAVLLHHHAGAMLTLILSVNAELIFASRLRHDVVHARLPEGGASHVTAPS
jgi:hypothetical protein